MSTTISSGISDDPTTWKVAMSAMRFRSPLAWLEHLHHQDEAVHEALGDHADEVLELAEQYRVSWSNPDGLVAKRTRVQIVARLRELGMDVDQIARLVDATPLEVVRLSWPTTDLSSTEKAYSRLHAERLLVHDLANTYTEVVDQTGLKRKQVEYMARKLGVARPNGNPMHVKNRALELYDEGWKPADIVKHCHEFVAGGDKLTASALYQWIHRSGRAKPKGSK